MNKKFINLLLASVLTAGSVQVFTSCKDNEADFQAQYKYDYESLEQRVEANEKLLKDLEKPVKAYIDDLQAQLNKAEEDLDKQIKDLDKALTQKIEDQGKRIDQVDQKLIDYILKTDAELINLQQQITNNFNKITNLEADLTILNNKVATLEAAQGVLEGRVDNLDQLAAGLRVDVNKLRTDLDNLSSTVGDLSSTVTDQGGRLLIVENTLADVKSGLEQLSTDFNDYKGATDGRLEALETFKNTWESILPEVQQNAIDALNKATANEASIEAIKTTIAELQAKDTELESLYNAQQTLIEEIQEKLNGFVTTSTFEEAIEELKAKDAELEALAMANYRKSIGYTNLMIEQVLEQMKNNDSQLKQELQGQIDDINGAIDDLNGEIIDIKLFQAGLDAKIQKNAQEISRLDGEIAKVNGDVLKLQEAINAVNSRIDAIDGRITSIVLQGTEDRVFGSLRLPVGIQSNMLISYFGEALEEVSFPLVNETAGTYNGDISNALTTDEATKLKVKSEKIQGLYMPEAGDGNGSLGYVYATINPSTVNVQDPKFEYNLVNSRGERIVEPMHFVPSDKELTFGYSRAGNDNGFYVAEASVKVDEASLNKIRFHFNDNLKTTVKDILKAPRASANKETVVKLANAVYDQVNGFLPAIGVEASWNDDKNGQMKVTSNYGIATAVVNPLSFAFLEGKVPGKHIPHILPAIDKIQDKFQVAFDEIKNKLTITLYDPDKPFEIGEVTLTPPTITIDLSNAYSTAEKIEIHVPEIKYDKVISVNPDGSVVTQEVVAYTGLDMEIDIAGDINQVIDGLKGDLEDSLSGIKDSFNVTNEQLKQLTKDIADKVNELLLNMQTTVDDTVDGLLADIQNKVNGVFNNSTLNRLVGRLDGIIDRLNGIMDNLNYYLQPVLLYNNHGDFGMISTSKAMPSVMVLENGGNAITLKPTTYTYETVVPVFKKYVAVTKVWENGDATETNRESVYDEANNGTGQNLGMNKVLSGADRQIILKLQKGYTYEIMYQALDYSGYVSGRKYYICVK